MVHLTKAGHLTYDTQGHDEQQALLHDLRENPRDYLAHEDAAVRSLADWAMEYLGIRRIRLGVPLRPIIGQQQLHQLHLRLAELQHKD